ncbi:putative vacuolar membrane protein [Lachnellula suecica]|uniref:Putative vacuolar membrane protein n=1 Tax=Lachnellula suecica TaxID=602035 RepID=A0A8T9C1P8_9HELO|nr:putative vacuolar membrane protein [Lachnellula suecica]
MSPNTTNINANAAHHRVTGSTPQSRTSSRPATPLNTSKINGQARIPLEADDFSDFGDDWDDDMDDRRSALHRPADGRSKQPLLRRDDDEERGRSGFGSPDPPERPPLFTRRSTMRSRSPDTQAKLATRKKYTYAAFFLGLSLVSFVIQTETAVYIQHELGWNKAYCMLYLTHGSWSLLWPFQLLILRLQKWKMPWHTFWRRHVYLVRTTAQMVELQELTIPRGQRSPIPYMLRMTAFVTCALTVAGGSWYVAVNLTSPSDLTAIYNCSAFFAYAFSVPILKEKLRLDKSFAVLVAIIGVLIVAYGDSSQTKHGGKSGGSVGGGKEKEPSNQVAGNLIIGVGSVLYGFYEVLYKRLACPPEGTSPGRGMIFANTFGSLIGSFTLLVLWVPLPFLHVLGWEIFELPRGETAWLLLISVLANATFSGSFLVLISLTSPVLSSVAALLTIFLVAIVDWLWTGVPLAPAAVVGGLLIIVAFLLLSYSTYREMSEERRKKQVDISESDSDKDDD